MGLVKFDLRCIQNGDVLVGSYEYEIHERVMINSSFDD